MEPDHTEEINPPTRVREAARRARLVLDRVSDGVLQQLANGSWPHDSYSPEYASDVAEVLDTMTEHVREARERVGSQGVPAVGGHDHADLLPLNRKERFYTGTLLPMVVASDGFAHLHRFLSLCGLDDIDVAPGLGGHQEFQFVTEYGFAESVHTPRDHQRWPDEVGADTPDVVLIGTDWLLAVEAKMFHNPARRQLEDQMARQAKLVDVWRRRLEIPEHRSAHVLLLPERLAVREKVKAYPVVTWEALLGDFRGVAPKYWLRVLAEALERHEELESRELAFGKNATDRLTGAQILDAHATGTASFDHVGRKNGAAGPELAADIASGAWRTRKYEVRLGELPGKPKNWFTLAVFVAATSAGPTALTL